MCAFIALPYCVGHLHNITIMTQKLSQHFHLSVTMVTVWVWKVVNDIYFSFSISPNLISRWLSPTTLLRYTTVMWSFHGHLCDLPHEVERNNPDGPWRQQHRLQCAVSAPLQRDRVCLRAAVWLQRSAHTLRSYALETGCSGWDGARRETRRSEFNSAMWQRPLSQYNERRSRGEAEEADRRCPDEAAHRRQVLTAAPADLKTLRTAAAPHGLQALKTNPKKKKKASIPSADLESDNGESGRLLCEGCVEVSLPTTSVCWKCADLSRPHCVCASGRSIKRIPHTYISFTPSSTPQCLSLLIVAYTACYTATEGERASHLVC